MDYEIHEGSIKLPTGFQDRTVNMFIHGEAIPAALSISISRDSTLPGEDLATYVARQVKMIAAQLRGYTIVEQNPVTFSTRQPLPGIQITAYYLKDGKPIHQYQAALLASPGKVLVFTTTSQTPFSEQQNESWRDLLSSFEPRQSNATEHSTQG